MSRGVLIALFTQSGCIFLFGMSTNLDRKRGRPRSGRNGKEVLEHKEVLQPSYDILAKANLKIAKFSENIVNAGPNSNVLSNENSNSVHCKLTKMELPVTR